MNSPMMQSCVWASTQKPYGRRNCISDITNCEQLPTSFMCNKFFFYKLPSMFNAKYYNCTVKVRLHQCTPLGMWGSKDIAPPILNLNTR